MRLVLFIYCIALYSCSHTIYVVRHAEKQAPTPGMSADVPLSPSGEQRAQALRDRLKNSRIASVYSTNTVRTMSTAKPAADFFGLSITPYKAQPDSSFMVLLKSSRKNILVIGHSNTVDDIANLVCGKTVIAGDLQDSEYDNLFLLKKRGGRYYLIREKYGTPSR